MLDINVQNYEELDKIFSPDNVELIEHLYSSVKQAYNENKNSADIFRITVGEADYSYEVSVPREEWNEVLNTVMAYFHKEDRTDECIDVWELQEGIKAGKVVKKKVASKNK